MCLILGFLFPAIEREIGRVYTGTYYYLAELCVVMTFDEKEKVTESYRNTKKCIFELFNKYRNGTQGNLFGDDVKTRDVLEIFF